MNQMCYARLRQNLAHALDEACASRAPLLITRQGGKPSVVLLAEAEFAGWQETVHLLSSPANAARLLASMSEADAGALPAHDVLDPSEGGEGPFQRKWLG